MNSPRHTIRRRTALCLLVCMVAMGCLLWMAHAHLNPFYLQAKAYDLGRMDDFNVTTVFYDISGEEVGRLFVEDRTLLKHEEIPDLMRRAAVAVEDRRFYLHKGMDYRGIIRAAWANIKSGSISEGASTITQQLAKNLNSNFDKTFNRKFAEAFLALRIERHKTKDEILDHYLNRIYFGKGSFGLSAAARAYFGKAASDMTLAECALLAGIIKSPNSASPRNNTAAALRLRDRVIHLMREQGSITASDAATALQEPLRLSPEEHLRMQSYFMAMAVKELREVLQVAEGDEIPQGLSVQTTLDLRMQREAEAQGVNRLQEVEAALGGGRPPGEPLQMAAVVLASDSGAVRVLVGGRNFDESPFDRARMARRENGALLQPFLYALAFERLGLHPASMIDASLLDETDTQKEAGFGDSRQDLGRRFLMVQDALALSNKASAARVGLALGNEPFKEWLGSAGMLLDKPDLEDSAGNPELLTLHELTSLYQMLGNGGVRSTPHTIESVDNDQGRRIYQAARRDSPPLLDPLVARQMVLGLQSVVRDGTASTLSVDYQFPCPIAGMTGYSEGYRDAWFVGHTPGLTAGVWVGYDQSTPIGPKAKAAKSALAVWGDIMQTILENQPQGLAFPVPSRLSKVEVQRRSGVIQGLGFISPGPGNVFVYLRQNQLNQAKSGAAATQVQQPEDWSDWLSTMFASAPEPPVVVSENKEAGDFPVVAEYRMPALRGDILTADGQILATMTQSQSLVLSWPAADVVHDEASALSWARKRLETARTWLNTDADITDADLRLLFRYRKIHPMLVAENLSPAQIAGFEGTPLAGEGFSLQGVPRRTYPGGTILAHALGYLQRRQGTSRKRYEAGEVVYDEYRGAAGLEGLFDRELRGEDGHLTLATTWEGHFRAVVVDAEATRGSRVRTTIDARVQQEAERAMEGVRAGAVVVMDVRNGAVLAMVSRPTFDPNDFQPRLSVAKWQAIVQAEKNPLLDRVYRQHHPPGSTFKVLTTLASMEAGQFDPARQVACPGYFQVGAMRYELPRERSGPVAFRSAIARSFNTYFFDLGLRSGREKMVQASRSAGLGEVSGFLLPGELPGLIPTPEFVRVRHKRSMGPGDVANMSIGQGDVLTTPLQMANVMCLLANGGTLFRPRLVQ